MILHLWDSRRVGFGTDAVEKLPRWTRYPSPQRRSPMTHATLVRVAAATSCLLLTLLGAVGATAQNISGTPLFGTLDLRGGFTPDPTVVAVTAGGADRTERGGCTAYITASAPDIDLNYRAGTLPLTISARSSSDVVLLVNAPDGTWSCDDDSGPDDSPLLTFSSPRSGMYNIWVGTYSSQVGSLPQAQVLFSELGDAAGGPRGGATLNWQANPTYGSITLKSGFTPDPFTRSIRAGGTDDVPSGLGSDCQGYVNAAAPDFDLNYSAGSYALNIYAKSSADVTLIVNLPDGSWACSDDAEGSNPHVRLGNPASGNYNIWIGTYSRSSSGLPESVLYISEASPAW
jgi:hypothetical protein